MACYVLDANLFIQPFRLYYPFDFAPGFWAHFESVLSDSDVLLIKEVKNELTKGKDALDQWIESLTINENIILDEIEKNKAYGEVIKFIDRSEYYKPAALRVWADISVADPWIIASANIINGTIVTLEQSAGKITITSPSGKPRIPDIAKYFDISCINLFDFMRIKGFEWK